LVRKNTRNYRKVCKETKMYSPRSCRSQRMGKKTQRI